MDTSSNSAQTTGFMVLDPNNDRGHQIDVIPEKGQEYQAVRIFGKDRLNVRDEVGNRHSRKGSNQSHKNKSHPEGWPVQVAAIEIENLGRIRCH